MIEELERLTREYFDEDETSTHLDYAVTQLQSGKTIADMARSITDCLTVQISREMLTTYLHSLPNASERIAGAKPTQALAMIEEAIAIVDVEPNDKLQATWARNRAWVRESHARMINPEFQPNKGTNVQIHTSIGMLHLTAIDPSRAKALDTSHTHARIVSGDAEGSALNQL